MKTIFTSLQRNVFFNFFLGLLVLINVANAQTRHIIEVSNNVFTPDELKISTGDTVEWKNIQGWHNVNGSKVTYPNNPESFGNSPGNGWTYSYVFNTQGKYDYQCDPHVNFGMTGKIEVEAANNDNKHSLTINFSAMNPHVGQTLFIRVYEKNSGIEIERKKAVISANFALQISGIEKEHSYSIDFFADHNGNSSYDAPNTDHAWRLNLDNVTGDTTLNFSHNTNFTDIMWKNKLTLHFTGMNPHVGQNFILRVVDKSNSSVVFNTQTTVASEFTLYSYTIETGKSYLIDFFADHNNNGIYDIPPLDHAWRLELNNVLGDTTLQFTHNINFTNIGVATNNTEISFNENKIYPNPATTKVTIELNQEIGKYTLAVFDISGKKQNVGQIVLENKIELNLNELEQGVYFIQLTKNDLLQTFKLIKK